MIVPANDEVIVGIQWINTKDRSPTGHREHAP